jgi:ribonuclease HI
MNNEKITITGNKKNTTNNQMELMAAIEALKKIPTGQEVQVYTDSKYVQLGITEWIEKWSKNNWKTSSKQKVKNLELWIELNKVSKKHKIEWLWVKGHAGDPINEEVDTLAKKAANLN